MKTKSSETALELVGLSVGYNERILLADINLRISEGKLVCFMGPNGVGKSTLIKTIAGLQPASRGEVRYFGKVHSADQTKQFVSLVLTDPIRAPYMTVEDLVTFGRYPYVDWRLQLNDADKNIINEAIRLVNIVHLRTKRLSELSDGQRQMAMIAKAVAQDTSILILDEPTAHLDLNNRVEIMRLLRNLTQATRKTVLMATHELDLALQTADAIWLAGPDKQIVEGTPEDLVLNGSFDSIFQFKGFDLRTGRVQHRVFRKTPILLSGSEFPFLWTKNALERNGYQVNAGSEGISIDITETDGHLWWTVSDSCRFDAIGLVLEHLESYD